MEIHEKNNYEELSINDKYDISMNIHVQYEERRVTIPQTELYIVLYTLWQKL